MPDGPTAQLIVLAADRNDVPRDLMLAIATIEGGIRLPATREVSEDELIPVAGALELRRGRFDSLARGAELMGVSELELQADLAAGTEAGARVLADLGKTHRATSEDLSSWASAVEELSGHLYARDRVDYRARVFALLRHGGAALGRGGEIIVVPPNDDVPVGLTFSPPALQPLGKAEYPGAIWFETPQCVSAGCKYVNYRYADIEMIAIHDTEGDWESSVATLQNDAGKSVHYIVDHDGSRVGQFIPESYTGWHVGNGFYNARMVGIEHVGKAAYDDYETALYEKSADLVKSIAGRHGLPLDRQTVVAHQEVPDGVNVPSNSKPCPDSPAQCIASGDYGGMSHHKDPGVYWEWCQYMDMIGGECKCSDTLTTWSCVHDLSTIVRCRDGNVDVVRCAGKCTMEDSGEDHCRPNLTVNPDDGRIEIGIGGEGAAGPVLEGAGAGAALHAAHDDENSGISCALGRARTSASLTLLVMATALAARRRKRH
jgi:hypothetical protein